MKKMAYVAVGACVAMTLAATGGFAQNLVRNGSFEFPYPTVSQVCSNTVTVPNGWCLVPTGTPGLEWTVVWAETVGSSQSGSAGILEIWRGTVVAPATARAGVQLMEFDTGGRPGTANANVKISQAFFTCPGAPYQLRYSWRPRPGVPASSQTLAVSWAGTSLATHTGFNLPWTDDTTTVLGTFGIQGLEFTGGGTGDQLGMLFDAVELNGPDATQPNACTSINVKPGSDPNSINVCSRGTTPVTIWGSATFDVTAIDPSSLKLGKAPVNKVGKDGAKYQCSMSDVGSPSGDPSDFDHLGLPDGNLDLTCHFVTAADMFEPGATTAMVTMQVCEGGLAEGCSGVPSTPLIATDNIRLVKEGCKR